MNKLGTLLFTIISLTIPSTKLLSSEKPKITEMNILWNISYVGGAGILAGATATNALQKVKKTLLNTCENKAYSLNEEAILKQLNQGIKNNKRFMGISFIATLAPMMVPAIVDQLDMLHDRPIETNKNLSKEAA